MAGIVVDDVVKPPSADIESRNDDRADILDVLELDAQDREFVLVGVLSRQPVGVVHHPAADDVDPFLLDRRVLPDPVEVALDVFVGVDAPDEGQCRPLLQLVENICRPSGRFAKQNR